MRHRDHMQTALGLAARGLGNVWPNPAVGCVLVKDGRTVGRGWTGVGGRPHAETEALERAGSDAKGATAYVTLEPCGHQGETPPCTDALIEAGVGKVIAAIEDPDPRVSGKGAKALQDAGIETEFGLCLDEARRLNAGFFARIESGRPMVTLKFATTLDGKIATHAGESKWITGEAARAEAHNLRASHDAILIGAQTAVADNPDLRCRLPGLENRSPVRIVIDPRLRVPLIHRLVAGAVDQPTWFITRHDVDSGRRKAFQDCGVQLIEAKAKDGHFDLGFILGLLAKKGITRLLVEGGSHTAASFLRQRVVDRVEWFRAPSVIGNDGLGASAPFGIEALSDMPGFRLTAVRTVGTDLLETYDFQT